MPGIDYKLVTQRLRPDAGGERLNPVLLARSDKSAFRPVYLNPNAAAETYTPLPQPSIVVDTTLDTLAKTATTWVNAAADFRERSTDAYAEDAILRTNMALADLQQKYNETSAKDTVDTYDDVVARANKVVQDVTAELDAQTKRKVLPRANALRKDFVMSAAQKKAAEFRAWQGQLTEAHRVATKQKQFEVSKDIPAFMGQVAEHISVIKNQQGLSKEQALVAADKYYNDALSGVIDQWIAQGMSELGADDAGSESFSRAAQYIEIGMSEAYTADGEMLANKSKSLVNAMMQAENWRLNQEAAKAKAQDAADKQYNNQVLDAALSTRNATLLNRIADPIERSKYRNAFDNLDAEIASSPVSKAQGYAALSFLSQDPMAALHWPGLNGDDKIALHKAAKSAQEAGATDLYSEASKWAKVIVPPAAGFLDIEKTEIAQTRAAVQQRLTSAITTAVELKQDPRAALEAAKQDILRDQSFDASWEYVAVSRELLGAGVAGVPNGGLMPMVTAVTTGILDSTQVQDQLDKAIMQAEIDVFKKYGYTNSLANAEALATWAAANPGVLSLVEADLTGLALQERYIISTMQKATTKAQAATQPKRKSLFGF